MSALALLVLACTPDDPAPVDIEVGLSFVLDPSGYAPLSGELTAEADAPVLITIRVAGDHGPASDVEYTTPEPADSHVVPVLGLYPDRAQDVEVVVRSASGVVVHEETFSAATQPLSRATHTDFQVSVAETDRMTPGFTLVSAFGRGTGAGGVPMRPTMFDPYGDVRWTLDFATHPDLSDLFYDVGVERLANGNLYFGDGSTGSIYEVDMLGRVLEVWPLAPYRFHHNVQEMPSGNFLVTASLREGATIEDQILEIDRSTKEIVEVWDLRESLDQTRSTWAGQRYDWVHVNAVQWDASDDTLVLSGRHQGVVKLTRDNEVVWILAPHESWGTAGDGTDLQSKLLTPLDAAGRPITEAEVLRGTQRHDDFEWNWFQHAVQVLGDGDIGLFDNGVNRRFVNEPRYSRAVRYHIDADAMTVQQRWTYGEARGVEMYSEIVSDIDVLADGHTIWSPGAVGSPDGPYGAIVELDADDEVVFEAKLWPIDPTFGITFHRTERLLLYP
jgi:arylsulfate sulfotransferase